MLSNEKFLPEFQHRAAKAQDIWPIDPNIAAALERYAIHFIPTGSFLAACLANDLADACARADDVNRFNLYNIVSWIYNVLPVSSYGSHTAVERWLSIPHHAEK